MFFAIICVLFALIPLSSIGLCFVRDEKRIRRAVLNVLLLGNAVLFLSPFIYARLSTWPDGNMWSENGPGAVFWFYYFLFPACFAIQIVLLVIKLLCRPRKAKNVAA